MVIVLSYCYKCIRTFQVSQFVNTRIIFGKGSKLKNFFCNENCHLCYPFLVYD